MHSSTKEIHQACCTRAKEYIYIYTTYVVDIEQLQGGGTGTQMSEEEVKELKEKLKEMEKEVSGDDTCTCIYRYTLDNWTMAQFVL